MCTMDLIVIALVVSQSAIVLIVATLSDAGTQWVVLVSTPETTEDMFRAEGKYPTRIAILDRTLDYIHKINGWHTPLIFAYVECTNSHNISK